MPRIRESHISKAQSLFARSLCVERLEAVARETKFVQRERVVTAAGVFWALVVAVGAHATQFISDVLRTLNRREGWSIRYKPFWNRLASQAFVQFMRTMFRRLCRELATRVLSRQLGSDAAFFSAILIDDGSSFAVADGLRKVFPGRFTKIKPAAVELHAHMNLLSDQVIAVTVAPDKEAERQYLPEPEKLPRRSLSLRDRGYIDLSYFERLEKREAYLICRTRTDLNPLVEKIDGIRRCDAKKWRGRHLHDLPMNKLRSGAELQVSWVRANGQTLRLRMIVRYRPPKKLKRRARVKERRRARKNAWLILLTNVPRQITGDAIVRLYRLRWQVELVFKEWKSYANLHALQSVQRHIVEGFIWASLCACLLKRALAHWTQHVFGRPISTRIAAQAGAQILPSLADWAQRRGRRDLLLVAMQFLAENGQRTHPERDRHRPHHILGLRYAEVRGG